MSENNSEPKPLDSRMVFIAIAIIAFIWVAIFIILPAVTGKAGVAQKCSKICSYLNIVIVWHFT